MRLPLPGRASPPARAAADHGAAEDGRAAGAALPFRRRRRSLILPLFLLALLLPAVSLRAQNIEDQPVVLTLRPVVIPGRTEAPRLVEVRLHNQTDQLIEGTLRLRTVREEDRPLDYTSPALLLAPGRQTYLMTLPAMATWDLAGQFVLEGELRLRTGGTIALPMLALPAPSLGGRSAAVGVCASELAPLEITAALAETLRFGRLLPREANLPITDGRARLRPEQMPTDPLRLCELDLLVLAGEGLTGLSSDQLAAVEGWVRAGGHVCVAPLDAALAERHLAFVRNLAGTESERFYRDPRGRLAEEAGAAIAGSPHRFRAGLGRAVVVAGLLDPDALPDDPAWRAASAFLWHLRADQYAAVLRVGRMRLPGAEQPAEQAPPSPAGGSMPATSPPFTGPSAATATMTADDPPLWQTLGPAAPFDSHSILELIPPSSVRLVPLPIVALILLGFVVLIGPGDYLLLGLVRRRKLTWVLFPVLTLGLTGGMMALSNHFMGSGAQVRAVVWLDLGEDGRPVRESRAEMHFTGRSGELELVGDDRLLTTWSDDSVGNPWSSRPALLMEEAGEAGIRYAGQMPGHYTLRRRVEQWSPIFARSLSLQAQAPPLTLHWEAIDPAVLDNEEATRRAVLRLVEAAGRPVQVHLYHGNTRWSLTPQRSPEAGPPTPTAWRRETLRREIHEMEYWDYQDYGDDVYNDPMSPWLWNTYLLDITTALPASGLFTLLGRLAPTDGPGGEDLVLLDPTDPTQWVVVVEFEYEGNHYYCRRVYHTPTEQP